MIQEIIHKILSTRKADLSEVLDLYDQLESVECAFMMGRWKGYEVSTGNKMDGMLKHSNWYGKMFLSMEEVHPLLFYTHNQRSIYSVNPSRIDINLGIKLLKSPIVQLLVRFAKPFIRTRKTHARLRMVEFRNKVTAAMVYDRVEIIDFFAKMSETRVLGIMDMKRKEPYVFILERDDQTTLNQEF